MITFALETAGLAGWVLAGCALFFLWRWERQLRGARIAIAFKRRVIMQPTLFDLLRWALVLARDKRNQGQVFYRNGGVTVAILKPRAGHGKSKTKTTTIKEAA